MRVGVCELEYESGSKQVGLSERQQDNLNKNVSMRVSERGESESECGDQ